MAVDDGRAQPREQPAPPSVPGKPFDVDTAVFTLPVALPAKFAERTRLLSLCFYAVIATMWFGEGVAKQLTKGDFNKDGMAG